jgi:hypothetical protein
LDTIENTIEITKNVTWKGVNPIVSFIDKTYERGVKITETETELEKIE